MPECVLAERRLNSTRRSIEALEVGGFEPVEGLRLDRRLGEHLLREPDEEPAVARLCEGIGDWQVRDCRREQHRPVRLLRPQVSEDRVGRPCVLDVAYESLDAPARPTVDLADVEGALAAEEDPPGADVVRAEVDEGADRALRADGLGDGRFVKAVLQGDDEPLVGEPRSDRRKSRLRVVRLDGEQADVEGVGQILRQDRRRSHRELLDRSLDPQPVPVDRLDVVAVGIAKEHLVAVARKPGADGAADRSRSDHHVLHAADPRTGDLRCRFDDVRRRPSAG